MQRFSLLLVAASLVAASAHAGPLPEGAVARIGPAGYRVGSQLYPSLLAPDGSALAVNVPVDGITVWKLPEWSLLRTIDGESVEAETQAVFQCVAFTPDSKKLVVFDANSEQILLYDLAVGKFVKRMPLPTEGPFRNVSLTVAADQKTCVFSWDETRSLKQAFLVCDLDAGKVVHSLRLEFDWQFVFAPDCRRLIRNSLEIWDLPSGKMVRVIGGRQAMRKMLWSPDGKTLAAIDQGWALRNFDFATGKERPGRIEVTGELLAFSPDSSAFYVRKDDGTIACLAAADNKIKGEYACPVRCGSVQLAFAGKDKVIALGRDRTALFLWDVQQGMLSPTDVPVGSIGQLAFSPKSELFIAAANGHAAWWNPRTAKKIRDLRLLSADGKNAVPLDALDLTIAADGDVVAHRGRELAFFDALTGRLLHSRRFGEHAPVCFFDHGKKAAILDGTTIRILDSRTGKELSAFQVRITPASGTVFLSAPADGKRLAIGVGEVTSWASTWDVDRRIVLTEERAPTKLAGFAISSDGRWVAFNDGEKLAICRVGKGREDAKRVLSEPWREISSFAFSPDGRLLAYCDHGEFASPAASRIRIYEFASKQIRLELPGHPAGLVEHLAFAPNGLLASAAADGEIFIWQAGVATLPPGKKRDADKSDLLGWFAAMKNADAKAAFQAMNQLAQSPRQAVELLARIPAAKPGPGRSVAELIADLGSRQFAVRNQASEALLKVGIGAELELRAALARSPDLETKRRIENVLERVVADEPSADELLHLRAVELAEAIATPEARALLKRWAAGEPAAILTVEARKALAR